MLKLSYLHLCLKSSNKIQSYTFNVFKPLTCTYYPLFPWLTNFSFSLFPPCLYFRQYTTQRLLKYLIRKIQNNYYNPIIFKFILDLIFDKKKNIILQLIISILFIFMVILKTGKMFLLVLQRRVFEISFVHTLQAWTCLVYIHYETCKAKVHTIDQNNSKQHFIFFLNIRYRLHKHWQLFWKIKISTSIIFRLSIQYI